MATPAPNVLPLSGDHLIDAMTSGYRWLGGEPVYYSFSGGLNGESWAQPSQVQGTLLTVFDIIDSYVAIDFAYAGAFAGPAAAALAGSDINLAPDTVVISDTLNNNVLAFGLFPNAAFAAGALGDLGYAGDEGDIFINGNSVADSYGYAPGEAGFSLVLHEIGHTLGLKHPHDDGGTGRPTFQQSGIGDLDIDWMTVMSYDDDYNWNLNAWDPATPMILDVIALQYLYGANLGTHAGNDTYALQSGTGLYRTIFDASGSDTLDLSGYSEPAYIDLPKYTASDYQYAPFGLVTSLADRNAISSGGSPHTLDWVLGDIETVIGSPFGDVIVGSPGAETLLGGGGNDDIFVRAGDDTVDGGDGEDWVYFDATRNDSTITRDGNSWIVESAVDGRNQLTNVEVMVFDEAGTPDVQHVDELAQNPIPSADDWLLLAADGQLFGVGGAGEVVGTQGYQNLFVLDFTGTMKLDASFNHGGDIVSVSGNAADWSAAMSGSDVLFSDGHRQIAVPIGPAGLYIEFDDGYRTLRFDQAAGQALIGTQAITSGFASVTAPSEGSDAPGASDSDVFGTLIMTGGPDVTIAGNFDIYGTTGNEQVNLAYGNFQLGPSFNRGGDVIVTPDDLASVTASVSESRAFLVGDTVAFSAPVGPAGLDIDFAGDVRTLTYDQASGAIYLGAQELGPDATPLTFA